MKNLLLTAFVAGLIVLGWHPGNGVRAAADRPPMRAVAVDSIPLTHVARASVRIEQAVIENGTLTLDVSYTGGCKVHDFKLLVDDSASVLSHQDYGDACETPMSESLRFDLSRLRRDPALPPISVSELLRS